MTEPENAQPIRQTVLGCGEDLHATSAQRTDEDPALLPPDDCLLLFCLSGQIICRFDKMGYMAQKGDVICFFPHQKREYRFAKNHHVAWIRLNPDAEGALRALFSDSSVCALGQEMQSLRDVLLQLQLEYHAKLYGWQASVQAYWVLLLTRFQRLFQEGKVILPRAEMAKILPALAHLEQDFAQDDSVEDYAKLCNLSTYHFIRTFRRYTGMSPCRYRAKLRIERACELLQDRTQSVEAVAKQVGYADPIHFSKQFKQYTGCAPRSYRKTASQPTSKE